MKLIAMLFLFFFTLQSAAAMNSPPELLDAECVELSDYQEAFGPGILIVSQYFRRQQEVPFIGPGDTFEATGVISIHQPYSLLFNANHTLSNNHLRKSTLYSQIGYSMAY